MRSASPYVVPSILFLLIVGLHWAQSGTVVAQIDLPPALDSANLLKKCAFVWSDDRSYFGSVDTCFSWLPYRGAEYVLDALFGTAVGQALLFILMVIASWLGAYRCVRALGVSHAAAFLAAWVYAFNPARQSMFGLFATGEAMAAALPWIVYWIFVASRDPRRRGAATAWIALVSFAWLVLLGITPQLLFALALAALCVFGYCVYKARHRQALAVWGARTLVVTAAASLWWLIPDAVSYLSAPVAHAVSANAVAWTFDRASLLNELRYCAMWFWQYPEYNPWAIEFDRNALFYISGFVPVAAVIAALFLCKGERLSLVRFFGILALIMLFVAKGVHPPLAQINDAIYALPGMFLLIEPYGPILIAALSCSICAALAIDALLQAPIAWRPVAGRVLLAASVALLFVNNLAAITGAIFHEKTNATPGVHIRVPDDWREAAAYVNDSPARGGVAVFPPDDFYQADYDWGYHGVDTLPAELFHRDVLMPGAPWGYTQLPEAQSIDSAIDVLVQARSPRLPQMLANLGVRYAVVRYDVHPVNHGFLPSHDEYAQIFGKPTTTFGALEIFDLGSTANRLQLVAGSRPDDSDSGINEADAVGATLPTIEPIIMTIPLAHFVATPAGEGDEREPRVVGETVGADGAVDCDVFVPDRTGFGGDVSVGAWPRSRTVIALTIQGTAQTRTVTAADAPRWVAFGGVTLSPGLNHLGFRTEAPAAARYAGFFPPRVSSDQPSQPHIGQVQFQFDRPIWTGSVQDTMVLQVLQALVQAAGRAERAERAKPSVNVVRGLGLFVHASLSQNPTVTVNATGARPTGWEIGLHVGPDAFTCFDVFSPGQEFALADSVRRCFADVGRDLSDDDAARTTIDFLDLEHGGPYDRSGIESVTISKTAAARVLRRSKQIYTTSMSTNAEVSGLGAVVHLDDAGGAPLVLSQTYSPTWAAVDLSAARVLPHWRAFGWRNAWTCPASGTILIFNSLSACSIALFAFGAVLCVVLWVRR